VFDGEHDHEIEEEQSVDLQPVLLAPEVVGGKEKKQDVEAKLDKIFKLVCVVCVSCSHHWHVCGKIHEVVLFV
jgi:hypothetical protein